MQVEMICFALKIADILKILFLTKFKNLTIICVGRLKGSFYDSLIVNLL